MNAFIEAHRARRRFSTDDLLALRALGITQTEAGRRLGVTQSAVAARLQAEGLSWPQARPRLDAEDFARLWNCHSIPTAEIARALGVTRQAISDRAQRMGLPSRAKLRKTLIRRDELRELWLAGVSLRDIARHFGLASPSCVTHAARNAGLPRRQRSRGGKTRGGWVGTISMAEFADQRLAALMDEQVRGRAA
ncbi:MAG: putative transcriptional regulator [Rhodobacteraceae bacterium HLUCCA12]|nr:MAG: putative transcriptional regulator [Rhodobacteraceae bacterium HLUCCA12]